MNLFAKRERFGARLNPLDPRDYRVESLIDAAGIPMAPIKASVDYEKQLGQIHYQGQVPSCTAFATAHQIYLYERLTGAPRISFPSTAFIYAGTRYWTQSTHGAHWTVKDRLTLEGTYPRATYQWTSKMGCPADQMWPYTEQKSNLNKLPDRYQLKAARSRAGLSYYAIDSAQMENVVLMLDNHRPPTLTVTVTPQWYKAKCYGELHWTGDETSYGLHRVCAIGYRQGYIKIANSWAGLEYLWLDESWIENDAQDIAVITRMN